MLATTEIRQEIIVSGIPGGPLLILFEIKCSFHSSAISLGSLCKRTVKQIRRQSTKTFYYRLIK